MDEPMELTNILHAVMISCKLKGDLKGWHGQKWVWQDSKIDSI